MNKDEEINVDGGAPTGVCPVSGLPVIQKPQWRDVYCSESFSCSYTIIGESIIMYQGNGFSDFDAEKKSVDVGNIIISKFIAKDKPCVVLQDWSLYEGSTFQARKYFIDDMVRQKSLGGVIFFNTTQMQRLSIRMGQAMGIVSFQGFIEPDYKAAILRALEMLKLEPSAKPGSAISGMGQTWRKVLDRPKSLLGRLRRKQRYIEDVTSFLREIDWQAHGETINWNLDPNHPFMPIFDAMIISKSKLDKTFEERDRVEQALRESEARYRELLEFANSLIIRWTGDGTITFFNEFAERTLGYKKNEVLGRPLAGSIVSSPSQGESDISTLLGDINQNPQRYQYVVRRTYRKDGRAIWIAWNIKAFMDEATGQMQALGIGSDITERIEADEELKQYRNHLEELVEERARELHVSEEHYREIYQNAPIGIFHCGFDGSLIDCNQAMAKTMGCNSPDALMEFMAGMSFADQKRILLGPYAEKILRLNSWLSFETKCTTAKDKEITLLVTIRRVREAGQVEGFFQDITKRKQAEKILREQAVTDELTGINNRRKLIAVLNDEFNRASRYGSPLTIAMIDLDDFKNVNDRYGHDSGDVVLKAVARIMADNIRESDCLGRYGGEEFCIVLPHTGLDDAVSMLDRMRERLAAASMNLPGGRTISITMSAGLAQLEEFFENPSHLVHSADQALYQAKQDGKNCVRAFSGD